MVCLFTELTKIIDLMFSMCVVCVCVHMHPQLCSTNKKPYKVEQNYSLNKTLGTVNIHELFPD